MGVDLRSDNDTIFRFSHREWEFNLNFAQACGWEPEGTKKPKNFGFFRRWHGRYDTNDGQYVLPNDAQNLSLALTRAMRSKNRKKIAQEVSSRMTDTLEQMLGGPLPDGYLLPSDIDIEQVIEFCAFCKKGGFFIE